jgi:dTDP-4-dehydrorhamnose reductase
LPRLCPIPTEDYPTSAARPKNSRLGGYRLKERFGIVLPDWKQGLALCLEETTSCRR